MVRPGEEEGCARRGEEGLRKEGGSHGRGGGQGEVGRGKGEGRWRLGLGGGWRLPPYGRPAHMGQGPGPGCLVKAEKPPSNP